MFNITRKKKLQKYWKDLQKYIGKNVVVDYIVNKQLIQSRTYSVPNNFSSWWKKNSQDWWKDSATSLFEDNDNEGECFIYEEKTNINSQQIIQHFLDGINHCVFTPIRNWANELHEGAKSKQTKSRYNIILKNLNELEKKYSRGLPENAVSEVCNSLQIDMEICLPFCETKFIEAQSIKKRLKLFKFMNTRLNHIDLNEVVNNDSFTEVDRAELLKIKADFDRARFSL